MKYKKRNDGRYQCQITVGRDWETGKPIRMSIYARTIKELEEKKAQALLDHKQGRSAVARKVCLGDYAKEWLELKKPFIERATYDMYRSVLKNHLGALAGMEMKSITKSDAQALINSLADKPRTAKKLKVALNQIFEAALDDNIVYRNPARNVALPKYEAKERRKLTDEEDLLTDAADFAGRERAFVLMMKWSGLRPEECLALKKEDFDFSKMTVTVSRAVEHVNNQPRIKDTKTKQSRRTIPLVGQQRTFMPWYVSKLEEDWLFTKKGGGLITYTSYRRMWASIKRKMEAKAEELGIAWEAEGFTPYLFRHNYATLLHDLGASAAEMRLLMGHSSVNTTNSYYVHLDAENLAITPKLDGFAKKRLEPE